MTDNLTTAVTGLTIVLEEVVNQLTLLRQTIGDSSPHSSRRQCIYNHECTNCGKCIEHGIEIAEVVN